MKKLLYLLLSLMFFPFLTLADVLPEPFDNPDDTQIEEIITSNEDEIPTTIEESTDNETADNNVSKQEPTKTETTNEVKGQADLVSIYFGFCNNGVDNLTESLNAAVDLGTPFRVCLMLYNTDKENDAYLDVNFVNGGKNDAGFNVCGLTSMDNFITSGELGNITIPADNYLIKEFEVTFPIGYDGEQHTCIGISSVDQNPQEVGGLKILARRAYYASFFVGGGDGLKNLLDIDNVQTKLDENDNLILSFNVNNKGNMENSYEILGSIKGLFNFQKDFLAVSGRVIPGGNEYVEIPLGSLPSYGGLFKINFTIKGTPYFAYDISNAKIDPNMLETKTFDFNTNYFKMPWLIFGIIVIFLILVILMLRKPKQKVIYVQQSSQGQQPQQTQQPQQSAQQYTQPRTPNNMQ